MAYEEKVAYEAINVAYENKRGNFFSPHLLLKNGQQFEKC